MDFFLCNNLNNSLFYFLTLFTFPRPVLPHTLVIIVCTNHLKISTSSRFDSVLISGIRFWYNFPWIWLRVYTNKATWAWAVGFIWVCAWMEDTGRPSDCPADWIYPFCHSEMLCQTSERLTAWKLEAQGPMHLKEQNPEAAKEEHRPS